jgi:hypothetical protein
MRTAKAATVPSAWSETVSCQRAPPRASHQRRISSEISALGGGNTQSA